VDDVLDYAHSSSTLGKPGGADLSLGLATGPALYAWEEFPEMGELITRKFERPGDVNLVRSIPDMRISFYNNFPVGSHTRAPLVGS
jgi:hexaprenyl-diphosphate synthase